MEGGTSDGVVGAPATSMESRDDDDANREGGCEKAEAFGGVGAADGDGRVSSAETFDEIASSDIEGEESDISAAAAAGAAIVALNEMAKNADHAHDLFMKQLSFGSFSMPSFSSSPQQEPEVDAKSGVI